MKVIKSLNAKQISESSGIRSNKGTFGTFVESLQ